MFLRINDLHLKTINIDPWPPSGNDGHDEMIKITNKIMMTIWIMTGLIELIKMRLSFQPHQRDRWARSIPENN